MDGNALQSAATRMQQRWAWTAFGQAIGFMYRNYKVLVSLDAKEDVVGEYPLVTLIRQNVIIFHK